MLDTLCGLAKGKRRWRSSVLVRSNATLVGALAFFGCDGGNHGAVYATALDSAGVRIVEVERSVDQLPEQAVLGPHDLQIGLVEGPDEYRFGSLSDVRSLPSGEIVVADRTPLALRVYDRSGRFQATVGREGRGPGEFSALAIAGVDPDGVWVWDVWQQRLTRLDHGLEVVEERNLLELGVGPITEVRMLPDGSGVVRIRYSGSGSFEPEPRALSLATDSLALLRFREGGGVDTLLVAMAEQSVDEVWRDADGSIQGVGTLLPFGATTLWVPEEDGGVTSARSDRFELVRRGGDGDIIQVSRLAQSTRPMDPAQVREMREARRAEAAGKGVLLQAVNRSFDSAVLPERMPILGGLLMDSEGIVWVGMTPRFPSETPDEWVLLDADRLPMGRVRVEDNFRVTEVGSDYVLGVHTDPIGVQFVRRHPLRWMD